MIETPQVLLEHYLKQLKLPTILREYPRLAEQCAKEGVDFQRFLLRLVEAEMLERDRKATERRIKAAKFPVVKSLETFSMAEVSAAIRQAQLLQAISFDAVKHLVLCAIEQRPPKLDLENYPHLPLAEVALTRAADYQALTPAGGL